MPKIIDLTGQRFGRLTAIKRAENDATGRAQWLCQCECGGGKTVKADLLRRGSTTSCGCAAREQRTKAARSQRHAFSKASMPREYASWWAMLARCNNPDHRGYHCYGGRGVRVCDRWANSFRAFVEDMGRRPVGHSLDRIDQDGHYTPDNCRWATRKEQANNRRNNRLITAHGKTMTIAQWAEATGLKYWVIRHRLDRGMSHEKCVS